MSGGTECAQAEARLTLSSPAIHNPTHTHPTDPARHDPRVAMECLDQGVCPCPLTSSVDLARQTWALRSERANSREALTRVSAEGVGFAAAPPLRSGCDPWPTAGAAPRVGKDEERMNEG